MPSQGSEAVPPVTSHVSQHSRQESRSHVSGMTGGHGWEMISAISPAVAVLALMISSPVIPSTPLWSLRLHTGSAQAFPDDTGYHLLRLELLPLP